MIQVWSALAVAFSNFEAEECERIVPVPIPD